MFRLSAVMVTMLPSSAVSRGFYLCMGQIND